MQFYIWFHLIRVRSLSLSLFTTIPQGAAAIGLLLMQQNHAIGGLGQKTICTLYLFFVSFPIYFMTFTPRLTFSCPHSSFVHLTVASQYIRPDGLITPSPSMGQLTERKQWWPCSGICGTQPQEEGRGEISCAASSSTTTKLVGGACVWMCVWYWVQGRMARSKGSWLYNLLLI